MPVKNAFYAQSGGVTSVINASASAVIQTAKKYPDQIGKVYAGKNGILGALREELYDTSKETDECLEALTHTPGGAFGSCRYKLKSLEDNRAEYERLIEVFKAHDIGYFFYNGGNDSADTCLKVSQIAEKMGYPLQAIHVPKTVDNDLPITDCCPGFGSVAKYVAVSTLEAGADVASMAETSTKVFIIEVMGRHAGWIAAAGGLANTDIILFPEVPFEKAKFIEAVDSAVKTQGHCIIVASEGAQDAEGNFLADAGTVDAFGHKQLGGVAPTIASMIREELGLKYHWALADYLQRSARHLSSKSDLDHAIAVGQKAVEYAIEGQNAVMPAIIRTGNNPYTWEIQSAPLDQIANVEKMLPAEYIREDGYGITEEARTYLKALIAGEAVTPWKDGLPVHAKLEGVLIDKKLADWSSN
ncbi:MAG: 6-phosphofructokinase [Porticoccaceae bacterium]|jgi:ATP-dependent phosphofructokinase / diphosphate-dependent phosphofructokinase|nr:6-phosphofructokinase [Porticoccaceae bacterium]